MKLQTLIREKKEKIIHLFCSIYGNQYQNYFNQLFDETIFLFPNLYSDDRKQYFEELCYHPNNIESYPPIIIMDKLNHTNDSGNFIPIIRKCNGILEQLNLISINVADIYKTEQNLDLILMHELKHLFTSNFYYYCNHNGMYEFNCKSGLSIKSFYENNHIVKEKYTEIGEVFTEYDAEILTYHLHKITEILPGSQEKSFPILWYQTYFPMISSLSREQIEELHQLEMENLSIHHKLYSHPLLEQLQTIIEQDLEYQKEKQKKL